MIGERLYDLRKDAGLTQDQLAEILKINKHSISSYERGKSEPPDDIKIAIARYFSVSVDYLLGLDDVQSEEQNDARMIRLPDRFPKDKLDLLLDYADYLIYKNEKKK